MPFKMFPQAIMLLSWLYLSASPATALRPVPHVTDLVIDSYIVEFEQAGVAHIDFYARLSAKAIAATPRLHYNHTLFRGCSFQLDQPQNVQETVKSIQAMKMVRTIWPIRTIQLHRPIFHQLMETSMPTPEERAQRRQTSAPDSYPPHVMGGVDKLHQEGFTGAGMKIALIDSGVDYSHPALGGGFGPGFKISFGTDLVGDLYNGLNAPIPDDDPIGCDGHGTHVAGIVGAKGNNPYNISGVAPDATLGMYKVFGCSGSTTNEVLIAAFNLAHDHGVDVISASVGGPSGWPEDPWAMIVARIVAAGTPCVLSAGNDGQLGMFNTSTAAVGEGVISVGSVDSVTLPLNLTVGQWSTNGGGEQDFMYLRSVSATGVLQEFPDRTLPIYATSLNASEGTDACSPLPSSTPSLANLFVLIRRGGCNFDVKILHARTLGGRFVIFYNNILTPLVSPLVSSASKGNSSDVLIPAAMVDAEQGEAWLKLLASGVDVVISTQTAAESAFFFSQARNDVTGGFMSYFSTWSPLYEVGVTPVVSAPGGYILSTWPVNLGGYSVQSGTSMAAPYVAGVIALLKQVWTGSINGLSTTKPALLSGILASTATPVNFNDGTNATFPFLAPIIQQGGGLVNAYFAAHAHSIAQASTLAPYFAFNDTRHFLRNPQIGVGTFNGASARNYRFSHLPAYSTYTLPPALGTENVFPSAFPPTLQTNFATVNCLQTIRAGRSSTLMDFMLVPPTGLNPKLLPVYNGYVEIYDVELEETFTIPYAGVASDLIKDVTIMDTPDGFPWVTSSNDFFGFPVAPNTVFTIPRSIDILAAMPAIAVALGLGTAILDVNVIPKGDTNVLGIGSMFGFPKRWVNGVTIGAYSWPGLLSTGEFVEAGNYTLRVRLLKLLGDPNCASD